MPKCIILNGASSSGKTTIAQELQKLIPSLVHIQIDNIAELYFGFFSDNYPHSIEWDEERYMRQVAIRQMLISSAKIMLKQNFDVVIDTGIYGPYAQEHKKYYLTELKEFKPIFIGVECGFEELKKRTKIRANRPTKLAEEQLLNGIHNNMQYDLTIDNTEIPASQNAKIILDKINIL
ncbi:MAG: phosphotransferase-like protein [Alphaproteobacteria bacterium]